MDPRLQASFIPKKPFTESGSSRPAKESINFFLLIGVVLFVLTIVAAIVVFVLNIIEQKSIASKEQTIQAYEQKYNYDTYQGFQKLNTRLNTAEQLLNQHVAVSGLFNILAAATAQDVSFTNLTYSAGATSTASLVMSGEGKNFNAVAFQSDAFQNVPTFQDVIFSGIKLDTKGFVDFQVNAAVNSNDFLFSKEFSSPLAPAAPASSATSQASQQILTATTSAGTPAVSATTSSH